MRCLSYLCVRDLYNHPTRVCCWTIYVCFGRGTCSITIAPKRFRQCSGRHARVKLLKTCLSLNSERNPFVRCEVWPSNNGNGLKMRTSNIIVQSFPFHFLPSIWVVSKIAFPLANFCGVDQIQNKRKRIQADCMRCYTRNTRTMHKCIHV